MEQYQEITAYKCKACGQVLIPGEVWNSIKSAVDIRKRLCHAQRRIEAIEAWNRRVKDD